MHNCKHEYQQSLINKNIRKQTFMTELNWIKLNYIINPLEANVH